MGTKEPAILDTCRILLSNFDQQFPMYKPEDPSNYPPVNFPICPTDTTTSYHECGSFFNGFTMAFPWVKTTPFCNGVAQVPLNTYSKLKRQASHLEVCSLTMVKRSSFEPQH